LELSYIFVDSLARLNANVHMSDVPNMSAAKSKRRKAEDDKEDECVSGDLDHMNDEHEHEPLEKRAKFSSSSSSTSASASATASASASAPASFHSEAFAKGMPM
jgi:hypothetical protein